MVFMHLHPGYPGRLCSPVLTTSLPLNLHVVIYTLARGLLLCCFAGGYILLRVRGLYPLGHLHPQTAQIAAGSVVSLSSTAYLLCARHPYLLWAFVNYKIYCLKLEACWLFGAHFIQCLCDIFTARRAQPR